MFKDCSEEKVEVIYDDIGAFLQDNVLNSVQSWGFERFELTGCFSDIFVGEVAIGMEQSQINCWWYEGGI